MGGLLPDVIKSTCKTQGLKRDKNKLFSTLSQYNSTSNGTFMTKNNELQSQRKVALYVWKKFELMLLIVKL